MTEMITSKMTTDKGRHVRIDTNLSVNILREDDCFVAYCPELELSSHGDSPEEAKKNFKEVLDIFFEDIIDRGTLEEVLEECGWVKVEKDDSPQWIPPSVISREHFPLHIDL